MTKWLKEILFPNLRITECRCCGGKLHKPGGYSLYFIGCGFCAECRYEILKNNNNIL